MEKNKPTFEFNDGRNPEQRQIFYEGLSKEKPYGEKLLELKNKKDIKTFKIIDKIRNKLLEIEPYSKDKFIFQEKLDAFSKDKNISLSVEKDEGIALSLIKYSDLLKIDDETIEIAQKFITEIRKERRKESRIRENYK